MFLPPPLEEATTPSFCSVGGGIWSILLEGQASYLLAVPPTLLGLSKFSRGKLALKEWGWQRVVVIKQECSRSLGSRRRCVVWEGDPGSCGCPLCHSDLRVGLISARALAVLSQDPKSCRKCNQLPLGQLSSALLQVRPCLYPVLASLGGQRQKRGPGPILYGSPASRGAPLTSPWTVLEGSSGFFSDLLL